MDATTSRQRPPPGLGRFLRDVATFLMLTLATPLAAELTVRLLDVRTEAPVFEPDVDADGLRVLRVAWSPQFDAVMPADPERQFRLDKPAGVFRIFVIGESVAEGNPYGTGFAFTAWLRRRLDAEAPGVRWEVVNAALAGTHTWSALVIVRDIARHAPDLLVVYLGHNDIGARYSETERDWLDPRGLAPRARLLDTHLYRLLSRVLPARATSRMIDPRNVGRMASFDRAPGGARLYATAADRDLSTALFRSRMAEIVRIMHAAGARTMLLTLSQNFADWAPAASAHRPDLRPDEQAAWERAAREGDALAAHDCVGAIAAWSRAVAIDDTYADLQFAVARCELKLGRFDAARARFRRASDLDRRPQGAPTSFNDVLRDVARHEQATLVDVDAVLAAASGPHLIGDDLFLDAVHPNLRAHQLIAAAVADAIRDTAVTGSTARWSPGTYVDPDPKGILAADPMLRAKEQLIRHFVCKAREHGCAPVEDAARVVASDVQPAAGDGLP